MVRSVIRGSKPEVEVALMIVSEDPVATADRAASMTSVGGFELRPSGRKKIHDVYFDTVDGRLRRRRMNLRVREVDGEWFVTLKHSPGRFSWRRDERRETELPWSQESLASIFSQLRDKRFRGEVHFENFDPVEVLKTSGLDVLQDRETDRRQSNVLSGSEPSKTLAELDVDTVLYHFKHGDINLFELELEAKSEEGRRFLSVLTKALREELGGDVRKWGWGKLATGRMIERLVDRGVLAGHVEEGRLRPEAYDVVREALTS